MGEYADDEINRAIDEAMFEGRSLHGLFGGYSYQAEPPKRQPKARDLRRLAGKLNAIQPKEKG